MTLRQVGCRDCAASMSGDCGQHGPTIVTIVPCGSSVISAPMPTDPPLDLAAIRRVCEQASPRFIKTFWPLPVPRYGIARPPKAPHLSIGEPLSEADIDFCVQARTALPQLLARVEEAKALIDTLAEYCCSAAPRQDHDEMMAWVDAWRAKVC